MSDRRLALRIARREAMRAKARSILVLFMITLPVLGVTAADVLYRTQSVNAVEGLDRTLGSHAAALVSVFDPATPITEQAVDPSGSPGYQMGEGTLPRAATASDLTRVLGPRPLLPVANGQVVVDTAHGKAAAQATELDLRDPLADGLFRLTSGRWPSSPDEVVVNADLAARGPRLGGRLVVTHTDGTTSSLRIVGLADSATYRSTPVVAGAPGSLRVDAGDRKQWLVGGGPVTWHDLRAVNALGGTVLSRAMVEHPPAVAWHGDHAVSDRGSYLTVLGLVVTMILIEVVLLAGPAFAVGARRQQRSLALLAATGGTPRQARRVVLASAIVLGGSAALLGVAGGIGLARLLQPEVQRMSDSWFGPFQVAWPDLLAVALFGLLSALLAAVVPAWTASRQDVVAVLAGRRGDRAPSRRSPVLGVLLLAAGIALAVVGAHGHGQLSIAIAAVICVLGMILLVPLFIALLARLARRLPLALRFAVRDADRHRTRTVPAIAAVAATVAGVVALGIALGSDEKESRATYQPELALGDATVLAAESYPGMPAPDWSAIATRLRASGLHPEVLLAEPRQNGQVTAQEPGAAADGGGITPASYGSLGTDLLVSDGAIPGALRQVRAIDRPTAARVLGEGGAVIFTLGRHGDAEVQLRLQSWDDQGKELPGVTVTVPALFVDVGRHAVPVVGVVAPSALRALGMTPTTLGLYLHSPHLSAGAQRNTDEAVRASGGTLYVERGYQARSSVRIVRLVLAVLGAVLMIGGTLTATFLALSDARPDLATLSAVGAAPRTRRAIAASYALTIGLPGAVLGAAVGFVPGLAIAVPLTTNGSVGPFFDVPWTLVAGLVIGLPLLVACLVWVAARSRLPMVARLS